MMIEIILIVFVSVDINVPVDQEVCEQDQDSGKRSVAILLNLV